MTKTPIGIVGIAAIAALIAAPAYAADMSPPPALKAPPPPPVPIWTGCYIDGGVGYGMWNIDHTTETNPGLVQLSESQTDGGRGWLGRVGGGCDYQFPVSGVGDFVIGAFGDYDFMSLTGTLNDPNVGLGGVFGPATSANLRENGAWYAGGRIGYLPYPNLMTFVSGGWTETQFNQGQFGFLTTPASTLTGIGVAAQTYNGWFVGGGYEYAVPWFRGLFWKTEYRYAQYQAADVPFFVTATGAANGFGQNDRPSVQTVTTSLVWKFNWAAPGVHW
ncbi:MAG TPA: porin family protein [Xanthobacteraceae bacterium]|nr:porin family protein [Xanthobacteraceae bacterium]